VDAAAWLVAQDPAWRAGVTHVTIDMSTVYKSMVGTIGAINPEIVTLAQTVSTWHHEIARGVVTGHSDVAAEGVKSVDQTCYRVRSGLPTFRTTAPVSLCGIPIHPPRMATRGHQSCITIRS
jgi:hypothetical protein